MKIDAENQSLISKFSFPKVPQEIRIVAKTILPSILGATLISSIQDAALQTPRPQVTDILNSVLYGAKWTVIYGGIAAAFYKYYLHVNASLQGREVTHIRIPEADYIAFKEQLSQRNELIQAKDRTIEQQAKYIALLEREPNINPIICN